MIETVIGLVHVPKHDMGAETQPSFRHGWHVTSTSTATTMRHLNLVAWRLKPPGVPCILEFLACMTMVTDGDERTRNDNLWRRCGRCEGRMCYHVAKRMETADEAGDTYKEDRYDTWRSRPWQVEWDHSQPADHLLLQEGNPLLTRRLRWHGEYRLGTILPCIINGCKLII